MALLGPGEYTYNFQCYDEVLRSLKYTNEYFSYKLVVQSIRVDNEDENNVRKGHFIIGVNGHVFEQMRKKDFHQLIRSCSSPLDIRFRDEKQAAIELKLMQHYFTSSSTSILIQHIHEETFESSVLRQCQDWLWEFKFHQVEQKLCQFSISRHVLIPLFLAEVHLCKVITSGDAQHIKEALVGCKTAIHCAQALSLSPNISRRKKQSMDIALAEAHVMYAVVLHFGKQKAKAAAHLRKAWMGYNQLHRQLQQLLKSSTCISDQHPDLVERVALGIGAFHLFVACLPARYQWLLTSIGIFHPVDVNLGLRYIRDCYTGQGLRSRWAALGLIHLRSIVVRFIMIRHPDDSTNHPDEEDQDIVAKLCAESTTVRQKTLTRYPHTPLFLWATTRQSDASTCHSSAIISHLESALTECGPTNNVHPHFIRADLGWHYFVSGQHFDKAAKVFHTIAQSPSASIKKRIECGIYQACALVMMVIQKNKDSVRTLSDAQAVFQTAMTLQKSYTSRISTPVIKRCARAFRSKQTSLRTHCTNMTTLLVLLPFEIQYIYWRDCRLFTTRSSSSSSPSTTTLYHEGALRAMDDLITSYLPPMYQAHVDAAISEFKNQPLDTTVDPFPTPRSATPWLDPIAEWLTLRGFIYRELNQLDRARWHFQFVIQHFASCTSQTSFALPVSYFRLAMDQYDRGCGNDVQSIQNVRRYLTRASARSCEYDYQDIYGPRIDHTLKLMDRMILRIQKSHEKCRRGPSPSQNKTTLSPQELHRAA